MASLRGHAPLLLAALGGAAVAATAILLYNRSTERQAAKEALSTRRATRRNVSPRNSPRTSTSTSVAGTLPLEPPATVDSTTAEREGQAHRGHPPLATLPAHEQVQAVHGHDALVAEPLLVSDATPPPCVVGRASSIRRRACSESDDDDELPDVMPPYTDMSDGESGISTASSNVYYTNIPPPVAPSFTGGTTASTTSSNARPSSSSSSLPSPSPSPPPPPRTALQLRVASSHWTTPPPPPLPPTGPDDAGDGDGPPSFRLPSSPRAWQYDHAAQWLRDVGATAGLDDGVRLRLAHNITDGKHLLGLQSVDDILKLIGVQGWSKGDVRWVLREANAEGVDPQFESEVVDDVRPVMRGWGVVACIPAFPVTHFATD